MSLPFENLLKSSKGQAVILYLLILIIGMTIVLTVASRVITDIRITTTSDESNRAYFAAEAGVEEALRRLQQDPAGSSSFGLDFTSLNNSKAEAEINNVCDPSATCNSFVYPSRIDRDVVVQVSFLNDFSDPGSGTPLPASRQVAFYWGASSTPVGVNTPALVISALYYRSATQLYEIRKYSFDPYGSRRSSNRFCSSLTSGAFGVTDTIMGTGIRESLHYRATINLASNTPCSPGTLPGSGAAPLLARIKLLYNPAPEPVAVVVSGGRLPSQGSVITSVGESTGHVTRRIRTVRLYDVLPAMFDYVLFNGSTNQDLLK